MSDSPLEDLLPDMNFLSGASADDRFEERGTFVPGTLPGPAPFLTAAAGAVLTGEEHVTVHAWTREAFEARGVYDVTFGYNLARLNLDTNHPDAGIRYARDGDSLRAVFTPTTPFCPQAETLAVAAFRAWNDVGDGAETPDPPVDVDRVRVRVADCHRDSEELNERLRALESA